MHIPDAYLSFPIAMAFWVFSFAVVALSFHRIKGKSLIRKERLPFVASMAMLVFALQMLNFPILGGTSGHFVGGVLLAFLFGFEPAVISMAIILFVQAFVFHDGGILALGANIFNMGILAPFAGLKVRDYFLGVNAGFKSHFSGLFTGSLVGTVLASISCALQIGLSGAVPLIGAISAMAFYHLFIGLGEGMIAIALLAFSLFFAPTLYKTEAVQ